MVGAISENVECPLVKLWSMGQTCVIPQIEAPLIPRLRCRANGRGGLLKGAVAVGNLAITPAASERRPVARFAAVILALALVAGGGRVCYFVVGGTEYAIVTDFGNPTQVLTSPDLGFKYPHQSEPSTVDSSMLRLQRVSDMGEDASHCG